MSGISMVSGASQVQMSSPVKRVAPEGSPSEENQESPVEKAREQKSGVEAAATPAPSATGVGQTINLMA